MYKKMIEREYAFCDRLCMCGPESVEFFDHLSDYVSIS